MYIIMYEFTHAMVWYASILQTVDVLNTHATQLTLNRNVQLLPWDEEIASGSGNWRTDHRHCTVDWNCDSTTCILDDSKFFKPEYHIKIKMSP